MVEENSQDNKIIDDIAINIYEPIQSMIDYLSHSDEVNDYQVVVMPIDYCIPCSHHPDRISGYQIIHEKKYDIFVKVLEHIIRDHKDEEFKTCETLVNFFIEKSDLQENDIEDIAKCFIEDVLDDKSQQYHNITKYIKKYIKKSVLPCFSKYKLRKALISNIPLTQEIIKFLKNNENKYWGHNQDDKYGHLTVYNLPDRIGEILDQNNEFSVKLKYHLVEDKEDKGYLCMKRIAYNMICSASSNLSGSPKIEECVISALDSDDILPYIKIFGFPTREVGKWLYKGVHHNTYLSRKIHHERSNRRCCFTLLFLLFITMFIAFLTFIVKHF